MYENILNDFDENGFDPQNTVVRCATQEEADIFLEYLNAKGVWNKEQIAGLSRRWHEYGSSSCYHFSQNSWCYDSYYKNYSRYEIIDFCDIYKKTNPIVDADLALGFDEVMQGVL